MTLCAHRHAVHVNSTCSQCSREGRRPLHHCTYQQPATCVSKPRCIPNAEAALLHASGAFACAQQAFNILAPCMACSAVSCMGSCHSFKLMPLIRLLQGQGISGSGVWLAPSQASSCRAALASLPMRSSVMSLATLTCLMAR